ncbi:MAG: NAD(+)/NADH kinase [Thermotogae bacterium]|nr:NAD(+)/NADH kinase [Thermotogota bacterium]
MKVGIYFNRHKIEAEKLEKILSDVASKVEVSFIREINEDVEDVEENLDLLIALGGDGTVLKAFHRIMDVRIPVLGVNFGKLGFLTPHHPEDMRKLLDTMVKRRYKTMELPVFEVEFKGRKFKGLNDLVVFKRRTSGILEISVKINGKDLGIIPADGVTVCTPIGSTAYNLSNGGAILHPSVEAFELSFIAPHIMSARPIVIGFERSNIEISLLDEDDAEILIDGLHVGSMKSGDILFIKITKDKAKLLVLDDKDYCELLVEKLGWGRR